MKRAILLLLISLFSVTAIYSNPNTFLATIEKRGSDDGAKFTVRLFQVSSDVDISTAEIEVPPPAIDTRVLSARVQGDQLQVLVDGVPYKQYRVSQGLNAAEVPISSSDEHSQEILDLLRYVSTKKDSKFSDVNEDSEIVQLSQDLFLHVRTNISIVRRRSNGYSYKDAYVYSSSRHPTSFVQYASRKIAYLDDLGYVRRFSLDKDDSTTPITAIGARFRDYLEKRNVEGTCAILRFQLDPIEYAIPDGSLTYIDQVIDTKDTDFVVECLQSLTKYLKIPFENVSWQENPLVRIAGNGDLATAKRVLGVWPSLVTDSTQSFSKDVSTLPIESAVAGGSVEMVRLLLGSGATFPELSNAPYSIYSNARSREMRSFLEGYGYHEVIEYSFSGTCNDNNVRIRKDYSTTSDILGVLNKGESVEILAVTAHSYNVGGKENIWYKVRFRNLVGWVFGQFLWVENDH